MTDTIFALATAPGRSAVAVLRLSGPGARSVLEAIATAVPRPRRATVRTLRAADGGALDQALVLWFPAPHSYTGEDCAELHVHGGAGVIDAVTAAVLEAGPRLARPGEFTRRAFENGKLGLDQAEAVADLIEAESQAQARQAVHQLRGALGLRYEGWRSALVDALAFLEAAVDFADEDLPTDVAPRAGGPLRHILADLDVALADAARGRQVRDGYRVAIIGAPNSGKSSLFNALVGRDAAIVTPIAGATRDVIEASLTMNDYQVVVADMAGLRDTVEPVEAEGVRRARAWASSADLRLWIVDRSARDGAWRQAAPLAEPGDLCLLNKADLPAGADGEAAARAAGALGAQVLTISLISPGFMSIAEPLASRLARDLAGSEFPAATRVRHERLLRDARGHISRALKGLQEPELAAEDTRLAIRALSRVTGAVGTEDILDRVFASFCIGK
ncbi:MAG: tRNA uridine-5-carboxymethylaminomethyl(34) synthesis GTPase MnmE [Caulobacteraceae bacterium]|nr:tRNA uridine-5-carboxymethylaminomethyl(34) synthesis GTPase MnmE [Caulobacteraceae bacterium]